MSAAVWDIEYVEEDQIFEKQDYGFMLVIPALAVPKKVKVEAKVNVIAPEEKDIILPPDVEVVSCFYKIETTGKFSKPIKLHLQHNVELTSQEECEQLAFIKAKGQPPYKFEFLSTTQEFTPCNNSGVIFASDFSVFSLVKEIKATVCQERYVMTVLFKHIDKSSWEILAVVTKDLGPFVKVVIY